MLLEEDLTKQIIGAAIEVHRELGPALLESVYEQCLCCELSLRNIPFTRQEILPVVYKQVQIDCGYRADVIVAGKVVIEVKTVDTITDLHRAQLLTYLRIAGAKIGLIGSVENPCEHKKKDLVGEGKQAEVSALTPVGTSADV